MFGKLWEWIMGIIAWIMSKFSRSSGASEATNAESVEGGAESSIEHTPAEAPEAASE